MQKLVVFLEKYVEWVAIALGGLFFAYMVYSYAITSPVSKQIGKDTVTIANVDQYVADKSAKKLTDKLTNVTVPKFDVEDFSRAVNDGLSMQNVKPTPLVDAIDFQPVEIPKGIHPVSNTPVVTQLPEIPPATALAVEHGHSTVLQPAVLPSAPTIGGAAAPAPAPATAIAQAKVDIDWATAIFLIPSDKLTEQWNKSFGPNNPGEAWKLTTPINTEFLSATLYRQEKSAGGDWSQPKEIARLWNNPLPPYPDPAKRNDEIAYQQWAGTQAADIVMPPFPMLAPPPFGTAWKTPAEVITAILNPVAPTPTPSTPSTPHPTPPPVIQRQPTTPPPSYNRPAGAGRGRREGGGGGGGNLEDKVNRAVTPPAAPPARTIPVQTEILPVESSDPKIVSDPNVVITVAPVPVTGGFDPTTMAGPAPAPGVAAAAAPGILVALHDDTVKPGTTYRYMLQYKLLNPLFNKLPERVQNAAWVDQFDLASPMSAPSVEITPEGRLFFYCAVAALPGPNQPFPFDIFTWAAGSWQRQTFKARPGDCIGSVNSQGVNFSTGYTYVDGRTRNGKFEVTLMDSAGNIAVRDADRDFNSKDRRDHNLLVDENRPPGS